MAATPSFAEVYDATAPCLARALRRLGVREADVPDVAREVFLVVHRQPLASQLARP
ncbi:MAG: hypothetical protein R2939_12150 [Kofleriaceae bacterium]